jgi:hypothetical protein
MVHMSVGDQDIPYLCSSRLPQDALGLSGRIDDHTLPGSLAGQNVTIVFKKTHFQPFDIQSTLRKHMRREHRAKGLEKIPMRSFPLALPRVLCPLPYAVGVFRTR